MLFFWWKKYDSSWIATFISFMGSILVTLGSVVLAAALVNVFGKNLILSILGVIVAIAAFAALKILLNMITDKIDNWHSGVSVSAYLSSEKKKKAKKNAILDEGNELSIYKMLKKNMYQYEDFVVAAVGKLTEQTYIKDLISIMGQQNRTDYYHRVMSALINRLPDENEKNRLKKLHGVNR